MKLRAIIWFAVSLDWAFIAGMLIINFLSSRQLKWLVGAILFAVAGWFFAYMATTFWRVKKNS